MKWTVTIQEYVGFEVLHFAWADDLYFNLGVTVISIEVCCFARKCELNSTGSRSGRTAGCYEHGSDPSGSKKV
jgi:hypothetical protein